MNIEILRHELNNTLNLMSGSLDLLKRKMDLLNSGDELLDVLVESTSHLKKLISDNENSFIQGMEYVENENIDISDFMHNTVSMVKLPAGKKGIRVFLSIDKKIPKNIMVNSLKLRQVLLNLLTNSIKFTRNGRIVVRLDYIENKIRFEVEDTGIGISRKDETKVFQPFERFGNKQYETPGTGMGLFISKEIMKSMGSDLQFKSIPGKSTKFFFKLNLKNIDENFIKEPIDDIGSSSFKRLESNYQKDLHVLIVDDEKINRAFLSTLLCGTGLFVAEASSGEDAVKMCSKRKYDLVLMDLIMPGKSGFDTAREIRLNQGDKTPFLVAVSGDDSAETIEKAIKSGFISFIPKPFSYNFITEKIRELLDIEWLFKADD